ncbi:MAG: hypothetical protein R3B09_32995 [Nannocystaceae bacterium]
MAEQKHYLKWPFRWVVLSERGYGFVLLASAIQYDVAGRACVLFVTCDGYRDYHDQLRAGRGYLCPVPVTVIGELEPGYAVIRSKRLRNGDLIFAPEEMKPLGPDYAGRYFRGEVDDEPPVVD